MTWKDRTDEGRWTAPASQRSVVPFNKKLVGTVAGCVHRKSGYVYVAVDGKHYLAHRLIWKWMTGSDPEASIDHEDTERTNNRWSNLRPASASQNMANRKLAKGKKLPKGVTVSRGRYQARLMIEARSINLGFFDTPEEAAAAYVAAAQLTYGPFARA